MKKSFFVTLFTLKNAPHQQAARDFMDFLVSPTARLIYKKYGFTASEQ